MSFWKPFFSCPRRASISWKLCEVHVMPCIHQRGMRRRRGERAKQDERGRSRSAYQFTLTPGMRQDGVFGNVVILEIFDLEAAWGGLGRSEETHGSHRVLAFVLAQKCKTCQPAEGGDGSHKKHRGDGKPRDAFALLPHMRGIAEAPKRLKLVGRAPKSESTYNAKHGTCKTDASVSAPVIFPGSPATYQQTQTTRIARRRRGRDTFTSSPK